MLWKQKRDMKVTKYIIQFMKQLLHAVIRSISNMYSLYDLFDFERSQFQRLHISAPLAILKKVSRCIKDTVFSMILIFVDLYKSSLYPILLHSSFIFAKYSCKI